MDLYNASMVLTGSFSFTASPNYKQRNTSSLFMDRIFFNGVNMITIFHERNFDLYLAHLSGRFY